MGGSKERGDRFFSVVPVDRTRGNGQQLIYRKSHLNLQLFFVLWGWLNTGTGLPERLWSLHPWRYSKPNWTRSWATCSSCHYLEQTGWSSVVPSFCQNNFFKILIKNTGLYMDLPYTNLLLNWVATAMINGWKVRYMWCKYGGSSCKASSTSRWVIIIS